MMNFIVWSIKGLVSVGACCLMAFVVGLILEYFNVQNNIVYLSAGYMACKAGMWADKYLDPSKN